jgi:LPXTG-motif cell wall-anchored protein
MRRVVVASLLAAVVVLAGVPASADPGDYPPHGVTFEVDPLFAACGATVTGAGAHWQPGSRVTFVVAGQIIGSVQAAAGGTFSTTFELPTSLGIGDHAITARGTDESGAPQSLTTSITITRCGEDVAGVQIFRARRAQLPLTGSSGIGPIAGGGVVLVLLGAVLVIAFTRRRRADLATYGTKNQ